MAIVTLKEFPEVRLGHAGSLYVSVWYSQATVRGMELLMEQQDLLLRTHPSITNLSVAIRIPSSPSKDVQEFLKKNPGDLARSRGTVIAILAKGLGAILARSFIVGFSLVSRSSLIVVKTLEEAAAEVQKIAGQDASITNDTKLAADLMAYVALPAPKS